MRRSAVTAIAVLLLGCIAIPDTVFGQEPGVRTVTIEGHRKRFDDPAQDAIVRYLLIDVTNGGDGDGVQNFEPLVPTAVLALFQGGDGRIFLTATSREIGAPSFPGYSRYHLAAEGFVVAAVDAASDFLAHNHAFIQDPPGSGFVHGSGLAGHQNAGRVHADKFRQDVEAVIDDLRQKFPGLPLWAVGSSLGTISAAVAATELANPPDGIVLTAPLTGPSPIGDLGPENIDLSRVAVPVLIVTNLEDECPVTRPDDAKALRKRFTVSPRIQVRILNGGRIPLDAPCAALSHHAFFGIEERLVDIIARWIKHAEK